MLRIVPSASSAGAAKYYTEGLKRADYYTRGQEIEGRWHGLALEELGLVSGTTDTAKQFKALLNNKHPLTGKQLTPRMNAEQKRIPGWDFVFSVPKSVSALHAITGDEALLEVFRESVRETMEEIEKLTATRVRTGGKQEDRVTGNFAWAEFLHRTTRPLDDGVPDPHLHIHAYVFNLTHDPVEDRVKAAKIRAIKDNAYFFEALHDSILARKLEQLGYQVERSTGGWELSGLNDRTLLEKFSRRTVEIENLAKELGVTDAKAKDQLGAKSRNRKSHKLTDADLVKAWKSRLTADELAAIQRTHERSGSRSRQQVTAAQSLEFAAGKWFERQSVVEKNRILASALKYGAGSVTLDDLHREMQLRRFIEREIDGVMKVTTPALVAEEALMIQKVREGRGKLAPLIKGRLNFIQDFLSKEQREAVRHLLKSNDQVLALRGIAGSGKTTLLTEVRQQLEKQGVRIVAVSMSADASRGVLREAGFKDANTIARFLIDKYLQRKARGHVLLIDEAGTVPNRDLAKLLDLAGGSTRVILSGDTGQHAPVGRGDAMRLLETYAGLPIATIRQIRRQESESYRKAVEAMADRDLKSAFSWLDEINAIMEIPQEELRYRRLAQDYTQCLIETGVPPLVVSPTHAEGREAVTYIRSQLRELGMLGPERRYLQYRDLKWEEVEKLVPENYRPGQMIQFHQNVPGIKRGGILPVLEVDSSKTVWVESSTGKRQALDLSKAGNFRVFQVEAISLAAGDRIKITHGGKDLNGRRLENGMLSTIKAIGKDGKITLANGVLLDPKFGHWAHGYDTSHSSQGKTAREVFVAQSSMSFRAGSMEQFYVSISRGRERLRIYTDDRTKLQSAVGNSARRLSALEFTGLGDEIFMNGGLSGKQWTERIAQGKAWRNDQLKTHVEKLAAKRGMEPKQGKIPSYVDYLEMRRANLTADGKHRSKGHPHAGKSKRQGQKRMPDPRKSELKARPKAEVSPQPDNARKAPAKVEAKPSTKKNALHEHVGKAVKAGANHLKEVVGRTKRGAQTLKEGAKRSIQFGKVKTTLGKLSDNPKTREARIKNQATKKPPTPKPPAPVIRRGK